MSEHDHDRLQNLVKQSLPPASNAEPGRDLWPDVLRRIHEEPAAPPWYDWLLATGVVGFAVVFPVSVPLLLYYL